VFHDDLVERVGKLGKGSATMVSGNGPPRYNEASPWNDWALKCILHAFRVGSFMNNAINKALGEERQLMREHVRHELEGLRREIESLRREIKAQRAADTS